MALSIGISNGSKIMVGPTLLVVDDILMGRHIAITFGEEKFLITDEQRTKVAEDVFISCGNKDHKRHERYTRLAFEAPRRIEITRVES